MLKCLSFSKKNQKKNILKLFFFPKTNKNNQKNLLKTQTKKKLYYDFINIIFFNHHI